MRKRTIFLSALLACIATIAYAGEDIDEPDATLFLNPYISSELKNISGHMVLDAGSQFCSWSIMAAQNGAAVCRVCEKEDKFKQPQMVQAGVELYNSSLSSFPYEEAQFDWAISVNTGSKLPTVDRENLATHFSEIGRVLKENGRVFIAAPASFGVVFTDGKQSEESVLEHISEVLAKIEDDQDPEEIAYRLKELKEVNRATFVSREGNLVLVTDEKQLKVGEPIWRKVPGDAVLEYYHSEEEYLVAIRNAGLFCEEIKRPCFFGAVKYKAYCAQNDDLGQAYMQNHPFTLYYVTK